MTPVIPFCWGHYNPNTFLTQSAKLHTSMSLSVKNKSLRQILNNKGPSADHCGAPWIDSVQELKILLIFTIGFQLDK